MTLSRTFSLAAAGLLVLTASAIAARAPQATSPNATPVIANPVVGGVVMDAARPIGVNAAAAPNLTTLVAAARAADLLSTLSGPGPYTVFAPTNAAFGRLPAGTVDNLAQRIAAGGGVATLTTVEGEPITVTHPGGAFLLTDVNGNKSYIETPDVRQSNGIIHVVNAVLVPAKLG